MIRNRQIYAVPLAAGRILNQVLFTWYNRGSASSLIVIYNLTAYLSTGGAASSALAILQGDGSTAWPMTLSTSSLSGALATASTKPVGVVTTGMRLVQSVADGNGVGVAFIDMEVIFT